MPFELEALVGHLYVVGGRAISTTPPGSLVEVAPKKAARGRELDTFFVMVLASGQEPAPTTFYQQMAELAAERFFSNTGSMTAALRNVFITLNQNLYDHNESGRKHYEANMLCAALHSTELYVARVGAAVSVLQHGGETKSFPEDLTNDETLFIPPLGVQPIPDVKMTRYAVGTGSRLLLGDMNLAEFELERLSLALMAKDLEQVIDRFKDIVLDRASLLVVELVPPEETVAVPVAIGESTIAINAELSAARAQVKTATQEMSAVGSSATPLIPPRQKGSSALQKSAKRGLGGLAQAGVALMTGLNRILDIIFPPPKEGSKSWFNTALGRISVFAIPLVIVAAVVIAWAAGVDDTAFEQCLERAISTEGIARSVPANDRQGTLAAWEAVLEVVRNCDQMRPSSDPALVRLKSEGQRVIDGLNNIQRRSATVITSLPNASLRSVLLQGLDLYTLDDTTDLVYRVRLNDSGMVANGTDAITSMRRGANVDGLTVGDIIDIGFDSQNNTIIALDSSGVLVSCPPRFILECDGQRILASETWGNPVGVALWQGRLYVLDSGVGQIWRYEPAGGTYPSLPTEYFTGQIRPNLANVVDFDIDNSGRIFILYSDGTMARFFGGQPEAFGFSDFPQGQELATATTQRMFLNDSPIGTGFYFLSRPTRTIYETTKAGTWIDSYRVTNEDLLSLMNDIAIEPGQGIIYVASGNALLAIPKAES